MLRSIFQYAFFTYYNETVFLHMDVECSESNPGSLFPRLFYSNVVKYSDVIIQNGPGHKTKILVRLGLLYLFKLANEPKSAFKNV